MRTQRLLIALTVVNLVLLVFQVIGRPVTAQNVAPVLRARALEIVDAQGRVRATLNVLPPAPMADGTTYPETVLLRLINARGKPLVKLGASDRSAGLGLLGNSDETQALIEAAGAGTEVKLTNADGRQQIVKP
jgi:hypothetical protein